MLRDGIEKVESGDYTGLAMVLISPDGETTHYFATSGCSQTKMVGVLFTLAHRIASDGWDESG